MDLQFTEQDLAFRKEVRDFCATHQPKRIRDKLVGGQKLAPEDYVEWQQILDKKGWAAPNWPVEWGGPGWNAAQLFIYNEELQRAPALLPENHNIAQVGPVIIAFGTDEQKNHFLPRIRNLDYWFCQGFSEPNAGSDLASLRTKAEKDGDHYVINGQKMWTTQAHNANWMFALVRTDPDATKHTGISYVLIDLATPGITIRPLMTMGHYRVNEVFFDNVRVPVTNRIGEENKGWGYAKYLMGNSRVNVARIGLSISRLLKAKACAAEVMEDGLPLSESVRFRERAAAIEVELKAIEITNMRIIADQAKKTDKKVADPKSSILKMKGTELQQITAELILDIAGPLAMPDQMDFLADGSEPLMGPGWSASAAPTYYMSRYISIAGGATEIQRNILAKRILGLS